jgi:NagD protein
MARAVLERLDLPASEVVLVGDRLLTDVRMAHDAAMTAVLVLTGATTRDELATSRVRPDVVLSDITGLIPSAELPATAG